MLHASSQKANFTNVSLRNNHRVAALLQPLFGKVSSRNVVFPSLAFSESPTSTHIQLLITSLTTKLTVHKVQAMVYCPRISKSRGPAISWGYSPSLLKIFLWSAKYDRENRKVYCPGRTTSHTEQQRARRVALHPIVRIGVTATWSKDRCESPTTLSMEEVFTGCGICLPSKPPESGFRAESPRTSRPRSAALLIALDMKCSSRALSLHAMDPLPESGPSLWAPNANA